MSSSDTAGLGVLPSSAEEPLLGLHGISVAYGKSQVLRDVSLEARAGEIVAILGRNGAGKTTALKTIMGIARARAGAVVWKARDISGLEPYRRARLGLGYVPQDRHLFGGMSVQENLKVVTRDAAEAESDLRRLFGLFPALEHCFQRRAATLSGGEQQMVAIARALVARPELLLLDEPTTGLSPLLVSNLEDAIRELNKSGLTVILVEERVPFAVHLAHRAYFMEEGAIVYGADASELGSGESTELFVRYLGVGRHVSP